MFKAIQFNKRTIDEIPPAEEGQRAYYSDARTPGLRISVTDRGSKSWVLQRRIKGQVKRFTLGTYPDLTAENAKKKAIEICGEIASGGDPQAEKLRVRAQQLRLGDAFEEMLRIRQLKPKTIWGYRQVMGAALGDWLPKPMAAISKQMVAERHSKLTINSGGAYADSAMRTLRSIWNFAAGRYDGDGDESVLHINPVSRLSKTKAWNRPKRRTTYIQEHDLGRWMAAVEGMRAESWDTMAKKVGDYLLLTLLTGLRRSEAANLQWQHINFKSRTLTVPDTKNHSDHILPLSRQLQVLLEARQAHSTGSAFVFSGENVLRPLHEPRYQMERVIRDSGVRFTMHDLRRTFATIAEGLDLSHYALKRLLNHRITGDVTAGYIGKSTDRLREPMQRISDFVYERAADYYAIDARASAT